MADEQPKLTVLSGPMEGTVFTVDDAVDTVLIGSDPSCRFSIDAPGVSPIHARLWVDLEGITVYDTNSPRGVFVNDDRVVGQARIHNGDIVWLGPPGDEQSVMLQARIPGADEPAFAPREDATPQETMVLPPVAAEPELEPELEAEPTMSVVPEDDDIGGSTVAMRAGDVQLALEPEESGLGEEAPEVEPTMALPPVEPASLLEEVEPTMGFPPEVAEPEPTVAMMPEVAPEPVFELPDEPVDETPATQMTDLVNTPPEPLMSWATAEADSPTMAAEPEPTVAAPFVAPTVAAAAVASQPPAPAAPEPRPPRKRPSPPKRSAEAVAPPRRREPAPRPPAPVPDDDFVAPRRGAPMGLLIGGGLAAAVLVAAGGWWVLTRGTTEAPSPSPGQVPAPPPTVAEARPAGAPTPPPALPRPDAPLEEEVTIVPPPRPGASPTAVPSRAPVVAPSTQVAAVAPPVTRPAPVAPNPAVVAADLTGRADAARHAGDLDAAADLYDQALRADPGHAAAAAGKAALASARASARKAFMPGRTVVQTQSAKSDMAGFDTADVSVKKAPDFSGRIEFAVNPPKVKPGDNYSVQIFLVNEGKKPIKVSGLAVTTNVNGTKSGKPLNARVKEVAPAQRALLEEMPGVWPDDVNWWSTEVMVTANKGDSLKNVLSWK